MKMIDFNKYFIVGTNSNALHDTMNGMVVGELIRCKDCKHRVLIDMTWRCLYSDFIVPEHYCGYAERKE
jgi:hypothetical protein